MRIKPPTIAIFMGAISLDVGAVNVNSAQAASFSWGVSFFDATGAQVGSGAFSYDPETTTFVQISPDLPAVPPSGFSVNTALQSFTASVLGQQWSLPSTDSGITWLDVATGLEQQRFSRSPQPTIADNWFFGDSVAGSQQLLLEGQSVASDRWAGSWLQAIAVDAPNSASGSGSWIAALQPQAEGVPEPTTVLGAVTLGAGYLLRKTLMSGKKS